MENHRGQSTVVQESSLDAFFHSLVGKATESVGVRVSEQAEHYLVSVLVAFARAPRSEDCGRPMLDIPLAFLLGRAIEAPPEHRMRKLRELGDVALFTVGFFGDSLERRRVRANYYHSMGGTAYASLSDQLAQCRSGATAGAMFRELADRFVELADVLTEISENQTFDPAGDLWRLFQRHQQTGGARLGRKLVMRGLLPTLPSVQ
jgi:hypothetical protein